MAGWRRQQRSQGRSLHSSLQSRKRRRRSSLLWPLLGLAVAGTAVALLLDRRDEDPLEEPPLDLEPSALLPPPNPPDNLSLWIPGPAGNLFVRDGGLEPAGALPIVFVHSLAGNGGQWALQLDHLRRRRRAVALDLRGHGDSDPAEGGDYSIAALANDVAAAADQLGLRRFVLAGHSLGSLVAIEYAGRHPERVAGLLLVDPNGDQSRVPREQVEPFLAAIREDPLRELADYFRQLVVGGDPDAGRWVLDDLPLTSEDAVVGALEAAVTYSPLEALARYEGPKLSVVSSLNDLPISLHKLVPTLPTRLLAGTGHWLMMDRPEAFNRLVDQFLAEVALALATPLPPKTA
jgi:pimeloyl-ACP methyl ester carboxylesterase